MKKILVALIFLTPYLSFATQPPKTSDFLGMFKDILSVESAELVFSDELRQEDIYKVTYTKAVIVCNSSTENETACGPTGEILTECRYALVDTSNNDITPTVYECTLENLEELIGDEGLNDEY